MWKLLPSTITYECLWPKTFRNNTLMVQWETDVILSAVIWGYLWLHNWHKRKCLLIFSQTAVQQHVSGEAVYCSWQFILWLHNLAAQCSNMKCMGTESSPLTLHSSLIFTYAHASIPLYQPWPTPQRGCLSMQHRGQHKPYKEIKIKI